MGQRVICHRWDFDFCLGRAAVLYPQAGYTSTPKARLPLQIDDAFGIVKFNQPFRYLSAISSSTLSDDDEIAQRLRSAAAAFGCLRK
jgi:hypothetical protein